MNQRTSPTLWEKRTINDYTNFNLLIEQLISGDNEAWSYFLKKYGHFIYSCISRSINKYSQVSQGSNINDYKEDCYQEVLQFLIADNYRNLKRLNPPCERIFLSWLYYIAYRFANRFYRGVKEPLSLSEETLELTSDNSIFQKIQRIDIIDIIIKKLSNQESIIILYLLDGLTLREISQLLNLNLSKVCNIKKKALYKLKKYIKNNFKV